MAPDRPGAPWFFLVVFSCLTPARLVVVDALAVRGVAPSNEGAYSGAHFTCLDKSKTLSVTAVNDNFCDCGDGSDEPGTAACSGLGSALKLLGFYCPNEHSSPHVIYFSRVGDGICDCCDGSDEWQIGGCKDVCEEKGRAMRELMNQKRQAMRAGIEKRKQKLERIKLEADALNTKLVELEAGVPALEADMVAKKKDLDAAEAEVRNLKGDAPAEPAIGASEAQPNSGISEYAKWMETENTQEPPKDGISEYAKWMETENTKVARPDPEAATFAKQVERKEVAEIRVRSGNMVDYVDFVYKNGGKLSTGGGNGEPQEPFQLNEGEGIAEVKGRQGGLLDSVQFVTTFGRESPVYGGGGGDAFSMQAMPGNVVVGLDRIAGTAGKIVTIHECLFKDNRTPEEKARDEALLVYSSARSALEASRKEIQELKTKISGELVDAKEAYSLFSADNCGSGQFDKYVYKICVFGEAKQGFTRLGTWSRWENHERIHSALYENGERCFSGKTRSARVIFECGENVAIQNVREPSQCVYEATMTHPAACDPKLFEAVDPGTGNRRVVQPHEAPPHDEL